MADGEGKSRRLVLWRGRAAHLRRPCPPDGKYVLFTGNMAENGDPGSAGAPMGLMRLADAPIIGGPSKELRPAPSQSERWPVLALPKGWEPCWTYVEIGAKGT